MKPERLRTTTGLTLVDVLIVIGILFILAAMIPCSLGSAKQRAQRVQCVNNLKVVGTAYRIWPGSCGDEYPAADSRGGWRDRLENPNQGAFVWTNYFLLNGLLNGDSAVAAKTLVCPADARIPTRDFTQLRNTNISYFVGAGANEDYPLSFLGGDRNLAPGTTPKWDYGYSPTDGSGNDVLISTNFDKSPTCWSRFMHSDGKDIGAGNILLGDGGVQQCSSARLRTAYQTNAADRGNFPIGVTAPESFRLLFP